MKIIPLRLLLCPALFIAVGPVILAQTVSYPQLFGVTQPISGASTLVQIDPAVGQATTLFSFPLSFSAVGNMTYCSGSEQFIICNGSGEVPRLAFLDPKTHLVSELNITGFPTNIGHIQSVTYYPALTNLVLTCGPQGTFVEDHLVAVTMSGQVTQTSQELPFPDSDYVAYNPATELLNIVDLNSGPGVQSVTDPFSSSPSFNEVGPGLGTDANYGNPAFSPDGQLFILHFGHQTLLKLSGQDFLTVGPFNNGENVSGLTFGYVPPIFINLQITNATVVATLAGLSSNQMVVFQSSTNLLTWTPVQTNAASGPTLSLTNIIESAIPAQFFRAVAY